MIGSPSAATLTIVNDDVPGTAQFSAPTYEVTEGIATATITVTRTGGTASGVTVQYRVKDGDPGSATGGGVDYTRGPGTLSFGVNEISKTFTVAIVNDTIIDDDETVNLELINPTGGLTLGAQSTAVLTIHDNDAPTFRFGSAAYTVAEGAALTVTVLRANGLGSAVTVDYAVQGSSTATGGQDYTLADGTVTFGVGITSQSIAIPTLQDTLAEGSETIVLKLVNPSNGRGRRARHRHGHAHRQRHARHDAVQRGHLQRGRERRAGDRPRHAHRHQPRQQRHRAVHDDERHGDGPRRLRSTRPGSSRSRPARRSRTCRSRSSTTPWPRGTRRSS